MLLSINNLKASASHEEILKGVNLKIGAGEVQAVLGPNASGKSTLAQVISGNPKYRVTEGKIIFEGKKINRSSPEERARMGIALAWQNPPAVKGVTLEKMMRKIAGSQKKFFPLADKRLLEREVNLEFSGGEKKISELAQILSLEPKLAILDEIDSGLDLKKSKQVAQFIKEEFIKKKIAVIVITHSGAILRFLKPSLTYVMLKGKVICQEKNYQKVLKVIEKYGYEKCKKCPLLAN